MIVLEAFEIRIGASAVIGAPGGGGGGGGGGTDEMPMPGEDGRDAVVSARDFAVGGAGPAPGGAGGRSGGGVMLAGQDGAASTSKGAAGGGGGGAGCIVLLDASGVPDVSRGFFTPRFAPGRQVGSVAHD